MIKEKKIELELKLIVREGKKNKGRKEGRVRCTYAGATMIFLHEP